MGGARSLPQPPVSPSRPVRNPSVKPLRLLVSGDVGCARIGRYGFDEPYSSGSPPDDALGESRSLKTTGDDTLGDGCTRDGAAGRCRKRLGPSRRCRQRGSRNPPHGTAVWVPTVWEAHDFSRGRDITSSKCCRLQPSGAQRVCYCSYRMQIDSTATTRLCGVVQLVGGEYKEQKGAPETMPGSF